MRAVITVVTHGLAPASRRLHERALRRGHDMGLARIDRKGVLESASESLVAGLDDVMVVVAVDVLDVQRDTRRLREGLEPFLEELGVHLAELRLGEGDLPDEIGPVRGVERDAGQRLVHGNERMAVAMDAAAVA